MHRALQFVEDALGSDWIIPISLGVLVSFDRIDWLTGLIACIAYVNLKESRP